MFDKGTFGTGTLRDCFHHHDWARDCVLRLAAGLSDEQLDQPTPMGWGSLRDTLRHLYGAQRFWHERWLGTERTPFPPWRELGGVGEIWDAERAIARARNGLLDELSDADLTQEVRLPDEVGTGAWPLGAMLLHLCNHGVHHRAQALNMLRHAGLAVPGLDYLFMRIEQPTVALDPKVRDKFRQSGLRPGGELVTPARLDLGTLRAWLAYGDWAQQQVMAAAEPLDDAALDRAFEMGLGTLRLTLAHVCDAEKWWCRNWTIKPEPVFEKLPATTSLAELRAAWTATTGDRDTYLDSLSDGDLAGIVGAFVAEDMHVEFRLGETILQLCTHGTHHRAQALNMLRQLGTEAPELDYYACWHSNGAWSE